jgi:hypothetical protein
MDMKRTDGFETLLLLQGLGKNYRDVSGQGEAWVPVPAQAQGQFLLLVNQNLSKQIFSD